MTVSSRTPEGTPNQCPICNASVIIEPSKPFGDAPCPACGHLLWFMKKRDAIAFFDQQSAAIQKSIIADFIARKLGVEPDALPGNLEELDVVALGGDSLDLVELVMGLEEEFDIDAE